MLKKGANITPTFKAKHLQDILSFTVLDCFHETLVDLVRLANHDFAKILRGSWLLSAGLHIWTLIIMYTKQITLSMFCNFSTIYIYA